MNVQGANLLSLLSGSENLGNLQQGGVNGDQAGFTSALMEQLGLLQGNLASGANTGGPDLAAIQNWAETAAGGDARQGLQDFAALFGKDLPVGSKINQDIDLEDTLQTLADVLQQLQQLEADTQALPAASVGLEPDTQQTSLSDAEQAALDRAAMMNSAVPVPVSVPQPELDELADQLADDAELSGILADAKKPAQILSQETRLKNSPADASAAEPADPALDFDRSISAMLAREGAEGKSQSDKSNLDFKGENPLGRQLGSQLDSQVDGAEFSKTLPGAAADIAKLNTAVRGESASAQPQMAKSFGDPAWNKELGEKLIWMHKQSIPSVELRLNPEHLGPVLIKVDVSHDQASIAFTAQNVAVKEAIEAAIPKLREMLNGQQLNLADVNVSQQQSDQRQPAREFFQMASEQGRNRSADADGLGNGAVNEAQDIVDEIEAGRAVASNGLLSLFA